MSTSNKNLGLYQAKVRGEMFTTGNVFFVDSGAALAVDSTAHGDSPERPFATVNYAIARCTASNGDIIYVMPGHAETMAENLTLDVAGISIIGMGRGTLRPTLTVGGGNYTVALSAANTAISNFRMVLEDTDDTVTAAFTITADGCMVQGCDTIVHATAQFTSHLVATDAQFVEIRNNRFVSLHTASSTSGVVLDGCDDLIMVGNVIDGHFTEHALDNTTPGACDEILRAYIGHNYIQNRSATGGDLAVELDAAATGIFEHNSVIGGLATIAANADIGNMCNIQSFVSDSSGVDIYGLQLGVVAA